MTEDWTLLALKEHFDTRFTAMETAVTTANAANEKRLDSVNEFRATLIAQQQTFITKEQVRWTCMAMIAGIAVATAIFAAVTGNV